MSPGGRTDDGLEIQSYRCRTIIADYCLDRITGGRCKCCLPSLPPSGSPSPCNPRAKHRLPFSRRPPSPKPPPRVRGGTGTRWTVSPGGSDPADFQLPRAAVEQNRAKLTFRDRLDYKDLVSSTPSLELFSHHHRHHLQLSSTSSTSRSSSSSSPPPSIQSSSSSRPTTRPAYIPAILPSPSSSTPPSPSRTTSPPSQTTCCFSGCCTATTLCPPLPASYSVSATASEPARSKARPAAAHKIRSKFKPRNCLQASLASPLQRGLL